MAAKTLVTADIATGLDVTKAIWNDPILKPRAALWFFDEDSNEWRFLIATAETRKRGPQAAYMRVRTILKKNGLLDKLPLRRVVVVDPAERLITLTGSVIRTADGKLSSVEFYGNKIDNFLMPDMYIYLMLGDQSGERKSKSHPTHAAPIEIPPTILAPLPNP